MRTLGRRSGVFAFVACLLRRPLVSPKQIKPKERCDVQGSGRSGRYGRDDEEGQRDARADGPNARDLNSITVVGESGAGLVKATATAKGELTALDIDPSIFSPDDKEVAEDLILAAIKDAQVKASDRSRDEMAKSRMGLVYLKGSSCLSNRDSTSMSDAPREIEALIDMMAKLPGLVPGPRVGRYCI